ncbi:MAG: hypothetical protein AAB576_07905, partial [Elusimicrobiota bacterium]
AQGVLQSLGEGFGLLAHLALGDDALLVLIDELDGSSTVKMVLRMVWLMVSMRLAKVVDLPEPVGPVTRTSPLGSEMSLTTEGIRPSSWAWGCARR